ncbi:hypothetical protein DXG01_006519 [Tephrocybe rancida]|nr:hypothetical protein DXG01_006519 [Tephrocybe rancida]
MDGAFDIAGAKVALEHLSKESGDGQLYGLPNASRLLKAPKEGDTANEEAVFTLQGVITGKDLPLLSNTPPAGRIRFLKQSMKLSRLGTQAFANTVSTIAHIHGLFDRSFSDGQLQEWISSDGEDGVLDFVNQYFTPASDVSPGEKHVPFEEGLDPASILNALSKKGFVRMDDNIVTYLEKKVNSSGETQ